MIYGYDTRKVSVVAEHLPISMIGLEPGDSITEYNDYSVFNPLDFNLVKYAEGSGDSEFTVKKADGGKEKYKLVRNIDETGKRSEIQIYRIDGKTKTLTGTYQASWDENLLIAELTQADGSKIQYEFKQGTEENPSQYVCVKTEYDANGTVLSSRDDLYTEASVQSQLASFDPYQYGFSFSAKRGNLFEAIGNAVVYNVSLVKSVFNL